MLQYIWCLCLALWLLEVLFIDVYKADGEIDTSGVTSLSDLDLRGIYRAIASVATGSITSLICGFFTDAFTSVVLIYDF